MPTGKMGRDFSRAEGDPPVRVAKTIGRRVAQLAVIWNSPLLDQATVNEPFVT